MSSIKQIEANRSNGNQSIGPKTIEGRTRSSRNSLKHGLFSREVLLSNEDPRAFAKFAKGFWEDLKPFGEVESSLVERIIGLRWRLRRAGAIEAEILGSGSLNVPGPQKQRKPAKGVEHSKQYFEDRATVSTALSRDPVTRRAMELMAGLGGDFIAQKQKVDSKTNELLSTDPNFAAAYRRQNPHESKTPSYGTAFVADSKHDNALTKLSRYETSLERSFYKALHELQRIQGARQGREVSMPVAIDVNVSGIEPSVS